MMENNKYIPILTIFISILALTVSVSGLFFDSKSNILAEEQKNLTVHSLLIDRNADLLEIFIQYPEIRPFFYDNVELPEDLELKNRLITVSELWIDFFEQVTIQLDNLPDDMAPTWRQYAVDMHRSSPAIREYFGYTCGWYVKELRVLWGNPDNCIEPNKE